MKIKLYFLISFFCFIPLQSMDYSGSKIPFYQAWRHALGEIGKLKRAHDIDNTTEQNIKRKLNKDLDQIACNDGLTKYVANEVIASVFESFGYGNVSSKDQITSDTKFAQRLQEQEEQRDSDYEFATQLRFNQKRAKELEKQRESEKLAQQLEKERKKEQEKRDLKFDLQLQEEENRRRIEQQQKSNDDQLEERRQRLAAKQKRKKPPVQPLQQSYSSNNSQIAPCLTQLNQLLYLPGLTGGALKLNNVFHVKSQAYEIDCLKWACGFQALYNTCFIEAILFKKNDVNINYFITKCREHNVGCSYDKVQNDKISDIAKELKLQPMITLNINDGFVRELNHNRQMWQNAISTLNKFGLQCIHFLCIITSDGISHGVLVTVVKMINGLRSLYIIDNMNSNESPDAQEEIKAHVEYIYKNFMK